VLTSVHIKNFRSCKDVRLEGLGFISALVGRNGAGKTTILRAIEWMARTALLTDEFLFAFSVADTVNDRNVAPGIAVVLTSGDFEYRYMIGSSPQTLLGHTDRSLEKLEVRSHGQDKWELLLSRGPQSVELADRVQQIEIRFSTAMVPAVASLLPEDDTLQEHLRRVMEVLHGVRYYFGHGIIDPLYSKGGDSGVPIRKDLYERWAAEDDRRGNDELSLLLRIIHAHQTAPEAFAELKSRVGPEGLGVIRDIRVNILGDMAETVRKRRSRYYEVVFEPMSQENVELSLGQLSRGTQQMLYLMLALLFDRNSTMLIEQPEDGIHPALLAKLIDLLKVNADPTQIILASHSPTVLSQLKPADVRLVEMVDGATRVRALTEAEVSRAQEYMQREGSLAEFLELIQAD
jgi:ABC-type branched-subunit amino acid transport system ATPase component